MLRDCIATWECSDCTGARLPPTCTHVQHTVDLGSAPTPTKLAKRSLTSEPFVPIPPRGLATASPPRKSTCVDVDEMTPRQDCTGIATHKGTRAKYATIERLEHSYED